MTALWQAIKTYRQELMQQVTQLNQKVKSENENLSKTMR